MKELDFFAKLIERTFRNVAIYIDDPEIEENKITYSWESIEIVIQEFPNSLELAIESENSSEPLIEISLLEVSLAEVEIEILKNIIFNLDEYNPLL